MVRSLHYDAVRGECMRVMTQRFLEVALDWIGYDLGYSEHHVESLADEKRERSEMEGRLSAEIDSLRSQVAALGDQLTGLKTLQAERAAVAAVAADNGRSLVPASLPLDEGPAADISLGAAASSVMVEDPPEPVAMPETAEVVPETVPQTEPQIDPTPVQVNLASPLGLFASEKTETTVEDQDPDPLAVPGPEPSRFSGLELSRVKSLVNRVVGRDTASDGPGDSQPAIDEPSIALERLEKFLQEDEAESGVDLPGDDVPAQDLPDEDSPDEDPTEQEDQVP